VLRNAGPTSFRHSDVGVAWLCENACTTFYQRIPRAKKYQKTQHMDFGRVEAQNAMRQAREQGNLNRKTKGRAIGSLHSRLYRGANPVLVALSLPPCCILLAASLGSRCCKSSRRGHVGAILESCYLISILPCWKSRWNSVWGCVAMFSLS
jgi:hypothetical protein